VVVTDNLPADKVAGIKQALQAAGASLLYLPPYSPDLNPIEQAFAKLKALLRKVECRTRDAVWNTIGALLDAFTPPNAATISPIAATRPRDSKSSSSRDGTSLPCHNQNLSRHWTCDPDAALSCRAFTLALPRARRERDVDAAGSDGSSPWRASQV
jgi:hypothetical protein